MCRIRVRFYTKFENLCAVCWTMFSCLGLKSWMMSNTVAASKRVHEMLWWEEKNLTNSNIKIAFTPNNHWCKRYIDIHSGKTSVQGEGIYWIGSGTTAAFYFLHIFLRANQPLSIYLSTKNQSRSIHHSLASRTMRPHWYLKHQILSL